MTGWVLEWVFDWVGAGGSLGGCSGGLSCDWVGACEDILCIDCVGGWVLEVLSCDWVGVGGSFVSGKGSFVSGVIWVNQYRYLALSQSN